MLFEKSKTKTGHIETPALIRVVDDNAMTCESLRFFFESLGYRVKTWTDPEAFLNEYAQDRDCGCLMLDIRMPKMSGLELLDRLNADGNRLPIVFLTGHGDIDMAVRALKQGALDFLQKPPEEENLMQVLEDAVALSRKIAAEDAVEKQDQALWDSLTDREKDVMRLVGTGLLNKLIADRLGISEKTVQQHRGAASRKLGVRNAVETADFLRRLPKEEIC